MNSVRQIHVLTRLMVLVMRIMWKSLVNVESDDGFSSSGCV